MLIQVDDTIKDGRGRRNWNMDTKFTLGHTGAMCHSMTHPYTEQRKAAFIRANAQGETGVHILASFFFMANLCKETCYG